MMTRKDYVATAEILSELIASIPIEYQDELLECVESFADYFASDNERFQRMRFIDACYENEF